MDPALKTVVKRVVPLGHGVPGHRAPDQRASGRIGDPKCPVSRPLVLLSSASFTLPAVPETRTGFALRPDAKSPFSGVEQPIEKPYTGQVSVIYGTYDDYEDNPQNLSDVDGFGLWVSARPSEWYIAPELGYLNATEDNGALGEIDNSEVFFGGRVTAELPFTPFSLIGGGEFPQLKVREYNFSADESGVYFHTGALLHLGDNAHLGINYRFSTYDDIADRSNFSVMTGVNW